MALIDDYKAAIENDTQFRQRLSLALTRVVLNVLAGTPTAGQQALGKRFLLSPESEVDRYLLPVAAKLALNGGSFTSDADVNTAAQAVLAVNVTLGIT
jgi:hypothetical protein